MLRRGSDNLARSDCGQLREVAHLLTQQKWPSRARTVLNRQCTSRRHTVAAASMDEGPGRDAGVWCCCPCNVLTSYLHMFALSSFDRAFLNSVLPSDEKLKMWCPGSASGHVDLPLEQLRESLKAELGRRKKDSSRKKDRFATEFRTLTLRVICSADEAESFKTSGSIPSELWMRLREVEIVTVLPIFWDTVVVGTFGEEAVRPMQYWFSFHVVAADFSRQRSGWIKTRTQQRHKANIFMEDFWLPFEYKFTALEVIRMKVDHIAFLNKNLFSWRTHIITKAGRVARDIFLESFPEENQHAAGSQMMRMALYSDHLERNKLWVGEPVDGNMEAWKIGRERANVEPPAGRAPLQVLIYIYI